MRVSMILNCNWGADEVYTYYVAVVKDFVITYVFCEITNISGNFVDCCVRTYKLSKF